MLFRGATPGSEGNISKYYNYVNNMNQIHTIQLTI